MFDRAGRVVSLVLGAVAMAYLAYEMERRRRKLHDLWDVLDEEDAIITAALEDMVASGELQPYAGTTLA